MLDVRQAAASPVGVLEGEGSERPAKRRRKAAPQDGEAGAEGVAAPEPTAAAAETTASDSGAAAVDGMESLMQLRSLLTPAGFGDSAADAATAPRGAAPADGAGAGGKPPLLDWTSRYHVVDASGASVPLERLRWPLHPAMERSLREAGFRQLFPIQAAVIPLLSRSAEAAYDEDSPYCCDVCVAAPTGQGKTLAYAVPLVQALLHRTTPQPRALVLLPTRDLAVQVFRVFEQLRRGLGPGVAQIRALCLTGQRSFAEEQCFLERLPPDVVVCTPGRLADHVLGRTARLGLGELRWFVVDEADRLLTQAYHRWLDVLERAAAVGAARGPRLQKLLLSATMTWNPQKLAMLRLHRPVYFFSSQTGRHATPAELRQHYALCTLGARPLAVLHVLGCMLRGELEGLREEDAGKALVFCPSVDTSHRLARLLQICSSHSEAPCHFRRHRDSEAPGLALQLKPEQIAEFSSNLSQRERTILLRRFRKGVVRCLVCSDVAARGIDIPAVSVVVNYGAPSHLQTYIHRVGRTARAGRAGHTFTLLRRADVWHFQAMLEESADGWGRLCRVALPRAARLHKRPWFEAALEELQQQLEAEGANPRRGARGSAKQAAGGAQVGGAQAAAGAMRTEPAARREASVAHPGRAGRSLLDFARTLPRAGVLSRSDEHGAGGCG